MPEFNEQDIIKFKDLISKGINQERAKGLIIKSKQLPVSQITEDVAVEKKPIGTIGQIGELGKDIAGGLRSFGADISRIQTGRLGDEAGMEKGILGRSAVQLKERGENVKNALQDYNLGKQGLAETFFQVGGQNVKGIVDVFGDAFMSGLSTITTDEAKEKLKEKAQELAETKGGEWVVGKLGEAQRDMEFLKENDPEAYRNFQGTFAYLEGLADISGIGTVKKGLKVGKEGIETGIKKGIERVGQIKPLGIIKKVDISKLKPIRTIKEIPGKIEKQLGKVETRISGPQEVKFIPGKGEIKVPQKTIVAKKIAKEELKTQKTALDILKPEHLTPKQLEKLKIEGKVETGKGVTGQGWKYIPDKKDLEIAKDSSSYLIKGKSTSENIKNLKKGIGELGEKTKQEIINKGDGIFNKKTINNRLDSIDKPVLIRSDASLNNAYKNTIKKVKDLIENSTKKRSELLKVRKEFDNFVNREFPNLYTSDTLTPMKTAIMDVRTTLNNFIAEGLPKGNKFRDLLKQQSNMYRAIDILGPKSDITKIGKTIKSPYFRYGAGAAAGGAIGTTIF